jgi:acyl-CoA synthetase (AMP-forming)/AMP-acid ligase II
MRFRPLARIGRPPTIADVLSRRADRDPTGLAYVFTDDAITDERLTYGELDARARAVSHLLIASGASRSRVLLAFPAGPAFVSAFFGTIYARASAVPVAIPRMEDGERERLARIVLDCRPAVVLTTLAIKPVLEQALIALLGADAPRTLAVDGIDAAPNGYARFRARPGDLAVVQYTSGSTGEPRGVLVKHENIIENQMMIADGLGHDDTTIVGGWLPHYHDMGLVGLMLHPMYLGTPAFVMPTHKFAERPHLWPQMISRYRITSSAAPSFAYELTARRTTNVHMAALDLSCWRVAVDGSEPVRMEAERRFSARFSSVGFSSAAFVPSYGLAEATLLVTGGPFRIGMGPRVLRVDGDALSEGRVEASADPDAIELVSSGRGHGEQVLRIVDPDTRRIVGDGKVGEIWIKGPHVAGGYFGRADLSKETFAARLDGDGPFLRTGDLGLVIDGDLFVTGRLRDLIVIAGKTHYPHDLEETFANALGVPERRVVAIADEHNDGSIVIVVERSRESAPPGDHELTAGRRAVFRAHGLAVSDVIVAPAGLVPRTSSGKKQRRRLRERLEAHAETRPRASNA